MPDPVLNLDLVNAVATIATWAREHGYSKEAIARALGGGSDGGGWRCGMSDVWVILWRYSDGSGSGIVGVYATEARAEIDYELLNEHGNRSYELLQMSVKS